MSAQPKAKLSSVPTMADLMRQWQAAKDREATANGDRLAIETEMVKLMPSKEAEDRQKQEIDGKRVTIAYGVSRKVDTEKLSAAWEKLAESAKAAFRWKAEVATADLKALKKHRPEMYIEAARFIETKASKPSVTIEAIEAKA